MSKIYDFSVSLANGQTVRLADYRGQVLLIVNVASKCGFTPQYDGLEKLHKQYQPQGFSVLGFPCNQFMAQESGSNEEIQQFCKLKYDVSFPVFAKIKVNGKEADPLYQYLKTQKRGSFFLSAIKWNFTKFLIGRDGNVVARFGPMSSPASLAGEIEKLLNAPKA